MAILTSKMVNLTYYNLKGGQFKVILTLKVVILTFKMVIFDLKVIKNGFGISAKFRISEFQISKIFRISDSAFRICLNISVSTPSLIGNISSLTTHLTLRHYRMDFRVYSRMS